MRTRQLSTTLLAVVLLATSAAGTAVTADRGTDSKPAPGTTDTRVAAHNTGDITTLSANGSMTGNVTDVASIRALRANGRLSPEEDGRIGDTLVFRFQSTAVNESFAATAGSNTTDRFFEMLAATRWDFRVTVWETLQTADYELAVTRRNTRVVRESANATFYVVVDTSKSSFVVDVTSDVATNPEFSQSWTVTMDSESPGDRDFRDRFEFVPPRSTLRATSEGVRVAGGSPGRLAANATSVTVAGTTSLPPGTNLTVAVSDPTGETIATERVTTEQDAATGRTPQYRSAFAATLAPDASDEDDPRHVTVTWRTTTLRNQTLVVGPSPRWSNLSVRVVESSPDRHILVEGTVTAPDDALLDVTARVGGEYRSASTSVPAGQSYQRLRFRNRSSVVEDHVKVTLYWDRDGDGDYDPRVDEPFETTAAIPELEDDDRVSELEADIPITRGAPTVQTATPTPTPPPEASTAERPTITRVSDKPGTGTGAAGPGFGVGCTVVAALVTLLAGRRRPE